MNHSLFSKLKRSVAKWDQGRLGGSCCMSGSFCWFVWQVLHVSPLHNPWPRRPCMAKTGHLLLYLQLSMPRWIACTCFIMWGLNSTGTITRFPLKMISSWMLSSPLKSKYLPISDGTSSLVSGEQILMICFNCWRPSSSSGFFLLRSTSRSLVIVKNSTMLISSIDFIRYSSSLIANTSDYNSFALGLLGRNARLSVSAMNSSFPGLYTIFKLYLRSCNNILWSLLGAGSNDFLKMLSSGLWSVCTVIGLP